MVLTWEKNKNTAIITMNNGKNRMDLVFVEELKKAFDEIIADASVKSVIITSSDEKFFSMGVNVDWVMERFKENDREAVKDFLYGVSDIFKRILLMPVPVIAAINGHAYGNGSIITCACDFRFMTSDRGYFCFPEVDINIPFLPGMLLWLQRLFPFPLFNDMALSGRTVTAPELEKNGIITKACNDKNHLMEEALSFAERFDKGRAVFGEIKKRMNKNIIQTIETEDALLVESLTLIIEG